MTTTSRWSIVAALWVPIVVSAAIGAAAVFFAGMSVAACTDATCDYAAAYGALVWSWIGLTVVAVATLAALIALRARRWRNGWLTACGIVLVVVITAVGWQTTLAAFGIAA